MNQRDFIAAAMEAVCAPLIVLTTGLLTTAVASAAPADLDSSFGGGGSIAIPIDSYRAFPGHVAALQPDGKLLVAATTVLGPQMKRAWMILRYTSDGLPDPSFGTSGSTVLSPSSGVADDDPGGGIALLADGRFLVAGESVYTNCPACRLGNTAGLVARFYANGSIDQSFGLNGVFAEPGAFNSIAIQDDGRIVVGSNRSDGYHVERLNADGSPDVGFAPPISCPLGSLGTFRLATDGTIVIIVQNTNNNFCVSRLNADGSLDATFAGQGSEVVSTGANDHLGDFFVDGGGSIAVAGSTSTSGTLFRLTPDGGFDNQFQVDAASEIGAFGNVSAVAGDCSNRTLVAGPPGSGGNYFLMSRFLADGSADPSFALPNDLAQTNISAQPLQLLVRPNGRIIILALALDGNALHIIQYQGDLPCSVTTAVEYYYAAWNFYFVTAIPQEIAALDGGAFGGVWKRTGQQFNVYSSANAPAAAGPVWRFFSTTFAPKSSHFYTGIVSEYNSLLANPDWQLEGPAFNTPMPAVDGTCSAGSVPIYRLYNQNMGGAPNHRFTTDPNVRAQMIAAGWTPEGFGIGVIFCSPQ